MPHVSTAQFLAALQEKFLDPDSPHRLWIVGGGGGLKGAFLAGCQLALVERGLHRSLSGVIGVSTSIPALGYLLAAEADEYARHQYETTMYSVEARSWRFVKWYGQTDVRWLRRAFEGFTGKPIRYERVVASGVRFVGVVTDWETGRPHYIEPSTRDEFFTLIEAGCSIPGLSPPVYLRGRLMIDSGVSDPCPIPWLMQLPENERPTHILLVTNAWHQTPSRRHQRLEWQLMRILFQRRVPLRILKQAALRHRRFYRGVVAAMERSDVQVAVEWLPWPQGPLERNSSKLEELTQAGYLRLATLLEEGDH